METPDRWNDYKNQICYPVEHYVLGFPVKDKERLIRAIISNQFLNEKIEFEQLKQYPVDSSLETIGDFVLDFVIIDNFTSAGNYTAQEIDTLRQFYGSNKTLCFFAKNCIRLYRFIIWGPDEEKKRKWEDRRTYRLADRFEMLIGVIYLEKGVGAVKEFLNKHNFFQSIDKFGKTI